MVGIEYTHIIDIPDSIGADSIDVVQKKGSDGMGQIKIDMIIFVYGPTIQWVVVDRSHLRYIYIYIHI